jgi:diguanylate cyclase (GGDEF)-like protein
MVDVDHFRRFNEESGHDAGDRVLRQVARALSTCVRDYDLAARYGGEEFTLVLGGVSADQAYAIAERARLAVESLDCSVTASFGCAVFPDVAFEAGALLKAADQALYEAKRLGRNRTVVFGRAAA